MGKNRPRLSHQLRRLIPPPIRFLALVLGAWCVGRIVVLNLPEPIAPRLASQPVVPRTATPSKVDAATPISALAAAPAIVPVTPMHRRFAVAARGIHIDFPRPFYTVRHVFPPPDDDEADTAPVSLLPALLATAPLPQASRNRWSGSAWLFARDKAGASLAPGGTLGGSQAGGRLNYALSDRAALSLRAYLPLEVPEEAEIAAGIDLQPIPKVPVRLLLERREAAASRGRSAFSATLYGGVSEVAVAGPVRLDAYAQVGVVGLRTRDLFADGSVRLQVKAGTLSAGAGAWAAAQPGVERVDIGPTLSLRLPVGTLQADWRFQVAGDARPASGPALTLSTAF